MVSERRLNQLASPKWPPDNPSTTGGATGNNPLGSEGPQFATELIFPTVQATSIRVTALGRLKGDTGQVLFRHTRVCKYILKIPLPLSVQLIGVFREPEGVRDWVETCICILGSVAFVSFSFSRKYYNGRFPVFSSVS